jgi:hypothetical protein
MGFSWGPEDRESTNADETHAQTLYLLKRLNLFTRLATHAHKDTHTAAYQYGCGSSR